MGRVLLRGQRPELRNLPRIEWQWAGYLPPSYRRCNLMTNIKRGWRRVRSVA